MASKFPFKRSSNKVFAMRKMIACLTLSLMLTAPSASAKDKKEQHEAPDAFKQVVACRQITEDAARLACYDHQVAALDAAEKSGEVIVADQQDVKETQQGLFGFTVPRTPLLGQDAQPVSQVETVVGSARQDPSGRWRIVMEDGAVWEQVDTEPLAFDPRPGDKVVIKRAAMGSFKARIDGQPPIRVRRVQ